MDFIELHAVRAVVSAPTPQHTLHHVQHALQAATADAAAVKLTSWRSSLLKRRQLALFGKGWNGMDFFCEWALNSQVFSWFNVGTSRPGKNDANHMDSLACIVAEHSATCSKPPYAC
eukprot:1148345-Pelagomonas_calceolata.AAC.3